jgi:hypothetical protein
MPLLAIQSDFGSLHNSTSEDLLMKRIHIAGVIVGLVFALTTAPSIAQESSDVHSSLTSKYWLSLGVYYPKRQYGIGVDGTFDHSDMLPDINAALDVDERDPLPNAQFGWRFGEKWALNLQYFSSNNSSSRALDEEIEWEDVVYEIGADVFVKTELAITRVFVSRHFLQNERHDLGLGFGLHAIDASVLIEGEASIDDASTEFQSNSASISQPLPNLEVWYRYSPSKRWLLEAKLDWLSVSFDELSGGLTDLQASAHYNFTEHFGVALSYQYFNVDADVTKDVWTGAIDIAYSGPALSVNAYW